MNYLIIISLFVVAIVIHELGHFLTAIALGVKVKEFSLFIGPVIFTKKIKGIRYSLRAIPLAAYVAFKGESLENAPLYKKVPIILGGVLANLLAAYLCWVIAITFQTQDLLTGIIGGFAVIGFFFQQMFSSFNVSDVSTPIGAVQEGGKILGEQKMTMNNSNINLLPLAMFSGINISLFVTNLLPLSVLDGGQLVFAFLNPVFGRFKSYMTMKNYFDWFSLALLLSIFIFALKNDIFRLFAN